MAKLMIAVVMSVMILLSVMVIIVPDALSLVVWLHLQ
jgi:hypothetical protein